MSVKVLVVDDEPNIKLLLTLKFKRRIHAGELQFFFVHNGCEALKYLERNPDIAVILSDLNMPYMDGLTLLTELQQRYPLVRTIILSAYTDMCHISTAMDRGAYGFLTKPLNFTDLETILDKVIRPGQSPGHTMTAHRPEMAQW
jgi:YesN/AraC family two-component response regulator